MKTVKSVLVVILIIVGIASCKKKENVKCDNARLCVKNIGSDTINYAWGSSFYDQVLEPGGNACTYVGEIEIKKTLFKNTESTVIVYFDSNHGSFAIEVRECEQQHEIE